MQGVVSENDASIISMETTNFSLFIIRALTMWSLAVTRANAAMWYRINRVFKFGLLH